MLYILFFNIYLVTENQLNWNLLWIHWCYTIIVRKLDHMLFFQKSIINNKGSIFYKKLYF
jgi:hypothetical protein